ncbi:MAG TPA: AAA family ATPase [Solirubrobacteraceae bacterium]|nr:AAA family ATPase [Solirubrobacteraceae bacterium]
MAAARADGRARPALISRGAELAAIAAAIEAARAGKGSVLVIEGPAGIGKSALLHAACERARAAGLGVSFAQGLELERLHPFGVARRLLRAGVIERELALAARRQGAQRDGEARVISPGGAQFALLERLYVRLRACSGPLLALDDAHWADTESLQLLAYAAARAAEGGLLLILCLRAQEPGAPQELLDAIARAAGAEVLRPLPLGERECGELLIGSGVGEARPELVAAAHRASGGNPFLLGELARALAARGEGGEQARAALLAGTLAPEGLGRLLLARLRTLSPKAEALAAALAVAGGSAELPLLAAVLKEPVTELDAAAELLAGAQITRPGRPLELQHPLVRAALYAELPRAAREATHRHLALLLLKDPRGSLDAVAAHLLQAEARGEPWAAGALERAAERALRRAAPQTAARYLERAIAELPAAEHNTELAIRLAEAHLRSGAPERAIDVLERLRAGGCDERTRARVAARLQQALTHTGAGDIGAAQLAEAITQLPRSERELGLELEAQLQLAALVQLAAARALAGRRRRFRSAARTPRTRAERLALAAQASEECARGSAAQAARLADLALADGRLLAEEGPESTLFHLAAYSLIHADRLKLAQRMLSEAIARARELGSLPGEAVARGLRAEARYRAGQLAGVQPDALVALAALRMGIGFGPRPAAGALVLALIDQGRPLAAARVLAEHDLDGTLPETATAVWLAHARGRLHAAAGEHARALREYALCERLERAFGIATPVLAPWRSSLARSLVALGREREAAALLGVELERARAFGAPRALGIALCAAGELEGSEALLREALSVLERSSARLEQARALLALGSLLRRSRRALEARPQLRQALALARAAGARALAQMAHSELMAAGGRERKFLGGGVEALSVSERRVAELAADGRSNRQIAAELYLSVRTVESHLAAAYRKLDVSGRRELAPLLLAAERGASE